MRTLAIENGDLVVSGGAYALRDGADKLVQDLTQGLVEPLGNDRFHPGWGSRLESYVGLPLTEALRFDVEREAERVCSNYSAVQRGKIADDVLSDSVSRYTTADVLAEVTSVKASAGLDRVQVRVAVRTAAGRTAVVSAEAG